MRHLEDYLIRASHDHMMLEKASATLYQLASENLLTRLRVHLEQDGQLIQHNLIDHFRFENVHLYEYLLANPSPEISPTTLIELIEDHGALPLQFEQILTLVPRSYNTDLELQGLVLMFCSRFNAHCEQEMEVIFPHLIENPALLEKLRSPQKANQQLQNMF